MTVSPNVAEKLQHTRSKIVIVDARKVEWNRFEEALEQLKTKRELGGNERSYRQFQTLCCRYIWSVIPERARDALVLAEEFSAGRVPASWLVHERMTLWRYLGKRSCDFDSREVNAVRAVICCLFVEFELREAYDAAANQASFCDAATEEVIPYSDLLRKAFAPPLDGPSRE